MRTILTRKASVQLEPPRSTIRREDPDEDLLGEREEENVFESVLNQVPQQMNRLTSEYLHYEYYQPPQLHQSESSARRFSLEEPPVDNSVLAANKMKEFQKRILFEILAKDVKTKLDKQLKR